MKIKIKGTDKVFEALSVKNLTINSGEAIHYYIIEDEYGVHQVISADLVEKQLSLDYNKAIKFLNTIHIEVFLGFLSKYLECDHCPLKEKCTISDLETCYDRLENYLSE